MGHGEDETSNRWEVETKWNIELFKKYNFLNEHSIVLDWGVGIGRMSKEIIEHFGCKVVGVDIDKKMLEYAKEYVNSDNFSCMTVEEFKNQNTIKFTNVICIWALQHIIDSKEIILLIKNNMKKNGKFFIFEEDKKAIPVKPNNNNNYSWILSNECNFEYMNNNFELITEGLFPANLGIKECAYKKWAFYEYK